jgi:succinate dehydrogenase / fumarate reductase flavoprotein subunit
MTARSGQARIRHLVTNVLVVGAGAAGLRAAIAVGERGSDVLVVAKRPRGDAHTVLAAGGINAVLDRRDDGDSWEQHAADTLREGYFLADPAAVELLAREGAGAIVELERWGAGLARDSSGKLIQRFFGAHRHPRTCFAGDYTGRAMLTALLRRVDELAVPIVDDLYVSRLLVSDGQCFGAFGFFPASGEQAAVYADAVVLACGGHTRVFRRSSSRRDENTGDGFALALAAGCELQDMEMVQFHPTGMTWPEDIAGTLVTEAVRGEGGRLTNALGERFMERYDPERLELSSRDRVARANYREIMEGRGTAGGGVLLDVTHLDRDHIRERLPRMVKQFLEHQMLDITTTPMEVAPTAHYSMGGVVADPDTHATAVEGLYAVGEVAAGVHGANRLGGNSLLECSVFGRRAGEAAAEYSEALSTQRRDRAAVRAASDELRGRIRAGEHYVRPLQRALRDEMWERCGVVRDETGLATALERLDAIEAAAGDVEVRPDAEGYRELAHALDLEASLTAARATVLSALERRESRGAHWRSDHPELREEERTHVRTRLVGRKLEIYRAEVKDTPTELRELANREPVVQGGLLE